MSVFRPAKPIKLDRSALSTKRPFSRTSAVTGSARIQRDGYGSNWFGKINEIAKRDGKKCMDCGSTQGPFHTHHIQRLSRGGVTSNSNLILLCELCHDRRHPGNHGIVNFKRHR